MKRTCYYPAKLRCVLTAFILTAFPGFLLATTYLVGHQVSDDYSSIYAAMNAASYGDLLSIADGNYSRATGEHFPLNLKNGVSLISREPGTYPHIVGDQNSAVIRARLVDSNTTLSGLWISGGIGFPYYYNRNGGGLFIYHSDLKMSDCIISGNTSDNGGGIYCTSGGTPIFENCIFKENFGYYGGGMRMHQVTNATITNCVFTNNRAQGGGGGLDLFQSSPLVTNCSITSNTSYASSAGVNSYYDSPTFINCVVANNNTTAHLYNGGGLYCRNNTAAFINCTFTGNINVNSGVHCEDGGNASFTNCIFWNNGNAEFHIEDSIVTFSHCDVAGCSAISPCAAEPSNIDSNPLFLDPLSDYHLTGGSPCIDAGTLSGAPSEDFDGNPRPNPTPPGRCDIGVDEYYAPTPTPTPVPTCPPCIYPFEVSLSSGWNLFGINKVPTGITDVTSLELAIQGEGIAITHIADWTGGGWAIYQVGLPFNNFTIEPQKGYMIRCNQGGLWSYEVNMCE